MLVKALNHDDSKRAEVWHVIMRRGEDLELLHHGFPTEADARADATRMHEFVKDAHIGIVCSRVDFSTMAAVQDPSKPRTAATLEMPA